MRRTRAYPDPDWDKSILALLNYPRQVRLMSEYIDWTEELGDRVVDDLGAVQAAVQEIRLAAYDAGFLKSDKHQKVELRDDQVRITSTDPKTVTIPRYDPAALLTALDTIEEADDTSEEIIAPPLPAAPALKQAAAPAPAPATTAEIPAQGAAAPASATSAPAAPPAAAPSVAPPVIAYGEPENSFWSDAAVFAGGAVVGGLLGWGLTEAFDDDDDHDHWDDDDWNNEDVEEALRERREFRDEQRDDVLAARNERLDTRQTQSAQRQADRSALRSERESNRGEQQAARQGQAGERQAARDQSRTEWQGGRAEQRAEREGSGADSREQRAAQAREQLNERPVAVGGRTKPIAAESLGPRREQARTERGAREINLPSAGTQAGSAQAVRQRGAAGGEDRQAGRTVGAGQAKIKPAAQQRASAQAGYAKPSAGQGIAAGSNNRREVRAEANRGAQSRSVGSRAAPAGQQRAAPVAAGRGGGYGGAMVAQAPQRINAGGGGGIASDRNRGAGARADAERGRMSRAGGGGGGRGGGGGGGRGR
ncbi:MAG: DUF3300 domain-containing protein [Rhodospirillales bacterium]|nr:DUF3300 domain-containing protein [Rhodospirillales bacterium]